MLSFSYYMRLLHCFPVSKSPHLQILTFSKTSGDKLLPSVITLPTMKSSLWTTITFINLYCCQNYRWQVSKPLAYLEMSPLFTAQIPFSTNIPVTNTSVELPFFIHKHLIDVSPLMTSNWQISHSQIPRSNLSSTDGLSDKYLSLMITQSIGISPMTT